MGKKIDKKNMGKEILILAILKWKKIDFMAIKVQFFKRIYRCL